jgi:hypothetical protein
MDKLVEAVRASGDSVDNLAQSLAVFQERLIVTKDDDDE